MKALLSIINFFGLLFVFLIDKNHTLGLVPIVVILTATTVIFYILLGISWRIVDKFADWFKPDVIIAKNPVDLFKKRLAYAFAPKVICIIAVASIVDIFAIIPIHSKSSNNKVSSTNQLQAVTSENIPCMNPFTIAEKEKCIGIEYEDSEKKLKNKFEEFISKQTDNSPIFLREEFDKWINERDYYCNSEIQDDKNNKLKLYKCLIDANNVKTDEIIKNIPNTEIRDNIQQNTVFSDDNEQNFQLGRKYARGEGVVKNFDTARQYFEKAAENNHIPALRALGTMYEFGDGVEINLKIALTYYEQAAKLGDEQSAKYYREVLAILDRESRSSEE